MDASIEVIVGLTNWLRQSDSARATVRAAWSLRLVAVFFPSRFRLLSSHLDWRIEVSSAYSAPPLRPVAPSIEVKVSWKRCSGIHDWRMLHFTQTNKINGKDSDHMVIRMNFYRL